MRGPSRRVAAHAGHRRAEIDGRLAEVAGEREGAASHVAAAALQTYDRLRKSTRLGGVVTARLSGNACGRCRIPTPVMHVTRIRRAQPDDVVASRNPRLPLLPLLCLSV